MQLFTPRPAPERHPAKVLVEETDPALRLDAHLELGRRAKARSDRESARTHFEEALEIDPTDERPRAELRGMGTGRPRRSLRFWRW
ncbi:MAG: hypothetical protein KC656_01180 [Myxococcales bacterium]|nr:hypothetical protein [Myxococcales bacterium]